MGDRAAGGEDGLARSVLDRLPLLQQRAVTAERVEGEIGRGAVGIDVGEAAGDFARAAGRLENRPLGRRLDAIVQRLEALPGYRRLKSVDDEAGRRQELAGVGHADEGVSPLAGR